MLTVAGVPGVEVRSAGTAAVDGAQGCALAPALAGRAERHRSQPVTADLVAWADLVLTAAREHQATVLALDPAARPRTFTIRQAGRLAQWLLEEDLITAARQRDNAPDGWSERFADGDPRQYVMPLPAAADRRAAWLVAELDAARGMAPALVTPGPPPGRWRRRRDEQAPHPDDIPDPHVLGAQWHGPAAEQIAQATAPLAVVLRELAG